MQVLALFIGMSMAYSLIMLFEIISSMPKVSRLHHEYTYLAPFFFWCVGMWVGMWGGGHIIGYSLKVELSCIE